MKAPKFWMVVPALLVAGAVSMVNAKLPPLSDEAKAKAAEAKAKAAETAKADRALEEKAMDRVADRYKMDRAVDRYKKEDGSKTSSATPARKK
jgi:hypothetical protein